MMTGDIGQSMRNEWRPSRIGRQLTGSPEWRLRIQGSSLLLSVDGQENRVPVADVDSYRLNRGITWADITLYPGTAKELRVDGLPNLELDKLLSVLDSVVQRARQVAELSSGSRPVAAAAISVTSTVESFNNRLEQFNLRTERRIEVMNATQDLVLATHAVQQVIKIGLRAARRGQDLEIRFRNEPDLRKYYEEGRATLSESTGDSPTTFDVRLPVFERPGLHPDPETEEALQCRTQELKDDYESVIAQARIELSSDPDLYDQFVLALEKWTAGHLMSVIDPESSLRTPR